MGYNHGVDPALEIALYISIIGTNNDADNLFVILYAFVLRHRSRIGVSMFRSISFAQFLITAQNALFLPYSPRVMTVVFIAIHVIIGFSTLMLTWYLEAYNPLFEKEYTSHPANPNRSDPIARSDTLSNRTYNGIKFIATILFPAAGALYFGLSQIWG